MVSLRKLYRILRRKGLQETTGKYAVRPDDMEGSDLFDAANMALERAGEGGAVVLKPGLYTKEEGKAVSTQLSTQHPKQLVFGSGAVVELEDGADIDMVSVEHNSSNLYRLRLFGNRDNNNIHTCIRSDDGLQDIDLRDIEVSDAPHGIHLEDISDSIISDSGSPTRESNVDVSLHLNGCTGSVISSYTSLGYNEDGMLIENCKSINATSIESAPQEGASATAGLHMKGVLDSKFTGLIDGNGDLSKGVLDEAYDVGGADERGSTGNEIETNVAEVNDIGYHIIDAEKNKVKGLLNGDIEDNGRTTQAWLVEDANGINNPQSTIDVDVNNVVRISDTSETGPNVGLEVEGHYSKVQDESTIGIGGPGRISIRFGQAVNSPAIKTEDGTSVEYISEPRRPATDSNGQVNIDWSSHYHLADRPTVLVTLEQAGEWYVDSWNTDADGRFTDADIQVTDSSGSPVGNNTTVYAEIIGA